MENEIVLNEPQSRILSSRKALVLVMAGQRGGKTYGIGIRSGMFVKYFPKVPGLIAANTYIQLTQSTMVEVRRTWKEVYGFTEYERRTNPNGVYIINKQPPAHFTKHHQFDSYFGIISFRNGAIVFTASLDNYLAHEGKTLGWAELDETKDTKEQAVKQVILARLSYKGMYVNEDGSLIYSDKNLQLPSYNPCFINTSPAEGVTEWLINLFNLKDYEQLIEDRIMDKNDYIYIEEKRKVICIYSTYWNEENISADYIENRLDSLVDMEIKKFIYGYPFAADSDLFYPYFKESEHVTTVKRLSGYPDHLTYDFNLVPYMTLVCSQIVETETEIQIRVYKEYCLKPPLNTTEAVTEAFVFDYGDEVEDIFYYGDAMGTRGVEGFGDKVTRFDDVVKVLEKYLSKFSDRTSRYNLGIARRKKLMDKIFARRLKVGNKKVVMMIDESCVNTIRDYRFLKLCADGKFKETTKDKNTGRTYEKIGHTSDAEEYKYSYIFEQYI